MATKLFDFRIYGPATSGVETTVASSNLRSAITVNRPAIDVLKGRSQSQPWNVEINDDGDFFSGIIADAGGRMAIQGRLCDARVNVDGAGFSVIGTGRIGDIVDHVSHYTVNVQDERWKERLARIFTKQNVAPGSGSSSQYGGTALLPAGLLAPYGRFKPRQPLGLEAIVFSTSGNLAYLSVDYAIKTQRADWNNALRDLIPDDVKSTARVDNTATVGNFNHLRANFDGTDYEVSSFDILLGSSSGAAPFPQITVQPAQTVVADLEDFGSFLPGFWLVDSSTVLATDSTGRVYLYMPTAEPNELMPLLIGGKDGIRPFQLAKDLQDEAGIVHSSSAMQDLIDDPDFGAGWWRITSPELLKDWLEDNMYGPYGVAPLQNSTGAVLPKKIHLPQAVESTDLFEFTGANMATQPTWHESSRDRITAIRFEYTHEAPMKARPMDGDWPADLIREDKRFIERTHDRLDGGQAPRREIVYQLKGVHDSFSVIPGDPPPTGAPTWSLDRFVDSMAREKFQRFGDGPIRGDIVGLSTTEEVTEGDFIRVTLETYPAPASQSRGASRIVQALSKTIGPAGPTFEYLDAGPDLNALVAPTLVIAPAASDPKHTILATVSGSSSTDVGFQLQWAHSTASTGPTNTEWYDWAGQGDSTGVESVSPMASGRQTWMRARTTFQGRTRSAWSAAADTTTEALEAPSNLAASTITGNTVTLSWDLGSSNSPDYPIEIRYSTGACPQSAKASLQRFVARTRQFEVTGLEVDSTGCFAVRHVDDWGGVSAEDTLTVEMTTSPRTAPNLLGVGIEVFLGETT